MNYTDPAPTLDDVWRLIRETDRQQKETDRQLREQAQEANRRFQEQAQEANRRFQEHTQEFDRRLQEQAQEFDRRFQEQLRETDKKLGKLSSRLGEFVEGLVAPAVVRLFQARGIEVSGLSHDIERRNSALGLATQIDLFVINGDSCILIEVKSKLSIDDVNEHLERMAKFKPLFPEYTDKKAYGAVAAMVTPDEVAKYAYRKGFFVLAQQGKTVAILNDEHFKPLAW